MDRSLLLGLSVKFLGKSKARKRLAVSKMRETYRNGDPIQLKYNGCDGCSPVTVNQTLCHESGCPDAWRDKTKETDDSDNNNRPSPVESVQEPSLEK